MDLLDVGGLQLARQRRDGLEDRGGPAILSYFEDDLGHELVEH